MLRSTTWLPAIGAKPVKPEDVIDLRRLIRELGADSKLPESRMEWREPPATIQGWLGWKVLVTVLPGTSMTCDCRF